MRFNAHCGREKIDKIWIGYAVLIISRIVTNDYNYIRMSKKYVFHKRIDKFNIIFFSGN